MSIEVGVVITFKFNDSVGVVELFDIWIVLLALFANYLLSIKVYQSWLIWIIVDVLSIGLMISQELWWSVGLYVILLINAVNAYITWKKEYEMDISRK